MRDLKRRLLPVNIAHSNSGVQRRLLKIQQSSYLGLTEQFKKFVTIVYLSFLILLGERNCILWAKTLHLAR